MPARNNLHCKPLFWFGLTLLAGLLALMLLGSITFVPGVSFGGYAQVFAVLFVTVFIVLLALSLIVTSIWRRFHRIPPENI
jgi:hypothetical protein